MACRCVAVEPRKDVARRRAAHPCKRRQRNPAGDCEQRDAGDAEPPRRELPHPEPRGGEEENYDRKREHQRRPHALDRKRALRQGSKRAKTRPMFGADG